MILIVHFLFSVLKRVGVEQVESVQEQTSVASTIAFSMAEQLSNAGAEL